MAKRGTYQQFRASSRRAWKPTWIGVEVALVAIVGIGVAVFAGRSDEPAANPASSLSRAASRPSESAWPVIEVYKDPTCGCCSKWVEHLQDQGGGGTGNDQSQKQG